MYLFSMVIDVSSLLLFPPFLFCRLLVFAVVLFRPLSFCPSAATDVYSDDYYYYGYIKANEILLAAAAAEKKK